MAIAELPPVYTPLLDYLVEKATPEEILAFETPEAEQQRAAELAARQQAGELTPKEAVELKQLRDLDLLIAALEERARRVLADDDTAANFRRGWEEALSGNTHPIDELWDDVDAE